MKIFPIIKIDPNRFNFNYMFCLWLVKKGPCTNKLKSVPCFVLDVCKRFNLFVTKPRIYAYAYLPRKLTGKPSNNRTAPFLQLK